MLLPLSVFVLFSLSCPQAALSAKTLPTLAPLPEHTLQCIQIVRILERDHFSGKALTNGMSEAIWNNYLKMLDPDKQLFTQSDINKFSSFQYKLVNTLKAGKLEIPFELYNLYMARSQERLKYILAQIKIWEKDFNFTRNDSIIVDEELLQWQSDKKSLYSLWKNYLKNQIILRILDDQDKESITDTLQKIYSARLDLLMQIGADDVFEIFMNSVTQNFDKHTQYLAPRVSEDFDIHMSLSLEGIGAVLQSEYGFTKIVRLIPKGPADKSKLLMPGDKIVGVGQGESGEIKDVIGQRLDTVVRMIRGPKGTFVRLKIMPAAKLYSNETIRIKRDKVKLEEQEAKKDIVTLIHKGTPIKIGIIEIPAFYLDFNAYNNRDKNYKSTTRDVQKLLLELKRENIDGLIIDLRNNGGGSLHEANELAGLFLRPGPTVQIKTKRRLSGLWDSNSADDYSGPLIVMINRMSASASEIFAGAIKDYNRGIIVGSRSFGKGTIQELRPLTEGRLKITIAQFYRVSGQSTQDLGVLPDIEYPRLYKMKEDDDEQFLYGAPNRIVKAIYNPYPSLAKVNGRLKSLYAERALTDPQIKYLEKGIRLSEKMQSKSFLTLNLKARKLEKADYEKQELEIKNGYRKAIGKKPIKKIDRKANKFEDAANILMQQTQLVMADLINAVRDSNLSW